MLRKWLLRLLAGTVIVVAVLVATGAILMRASLPALDGSIVDASLQSPVTIERDAAGVPVITAANRPDLAFATGFAHGQDRFFQMDLIRRQAAGELAALFGPRAVDSDRWHRFHRFRVLAREVLANLDGPERELIGRYADGVNAGLASLDAMPFEYWVLRKDPDPWLAEDTLIVVYAMFMQLNDSRARSDVRHGLAERAMPAEVYAWLYPEGTSWDAALAGEPRETRPWPLSATYDVRGFASEVPRIAEQGPPPFVGSNNWAVSGALTASGRAMVSNDMHLGLSAPNIYYRARLVQTGSAPRDVSGVTLPGAPLVVAGSNGHIAWGYTNSQGDWSDAVLLRPGAADGTYRTPAGDLPFVEHREVIEVAGGADVDYVIRTTIWGPVDETTSYPDGEIAVSWIAHHPRAVNLRILALETARSASEALDIANTMGMPPQNFVTGDADGNIGWTIAGQIPLRADFDARIPADWSTQAGWQGWRAPAQYPRIYNPPGGRIWTANARVVDGDALTVLGDGGYDLGARAGQIRDLLEEQSQFSPADMLAIQNDDRALFLAPWRDLLLEVLDEKAIADDPDLRAYRELVAAWIPRATPESVGYRLVRGFRLEVRARVFAVLTAPVRAQYEEAPDLVIGNQFEAPLWQLVTERPAHLLSSDYASWRALLLASVRANLDWYAENYDTSLAERSWGEYNTASIRHPLSPALPGFSDWLDMPADPLAGDSNMPRAQGPSFGASERFSVAPGDEANGLMQMPTGQSGHPLSPFYRAGHDAWVRGDPLPFLPGPARHTLKLGPPDGKMAASKDDGE